jgi:hypothetical protein
MLKIAVVMIIIKFPNAGLDRKKPDGPTYVICPSIISPQHICAFPYQNNHSLLAITSTTKLTENICMQFLLFTQFSLNYSLVRDMTFMPNSFKFKNNGLIETARKGVIKICNESHYACCHTHVTNST